MSDNTSTVDGDGSVGKPNLEELLDSALQDFNDASEDTGERVEEKLMPVFTKEDNMRGGGAQSSGEKKKDGQPGAGNCGSLLFGDGDVESTLKAILNASDDTTESSSVDKVVADAMEKLMKSSKGVGDDLPEMLKGLDTNDESALFPFVQGALQTFLCKDIIYPSMSEIKDRYPGWIAENKDRLSEGDLNRFVKQYNYIEQICTEFENEKDGDSEETKKTRFQKLLDLMQKVNECGDPPSELVGDQLYRPGGMNSTDNVGGLNQCPIS